MMRIKSILFTFSFLLFCGFFSSSGIAQTESKETKVGETYFSICSENIVTEKNKLSLKTKALADTIDNKNSLKLVHYYVDDRKRRYKTTEEQIAKAKSTDKALLEYKNFLNNLETLPFFVNGKKFTGVLKMGIPFKNEGFYQVDSGYDLIIYEFNEGVFLSKHTLRDVNLESEIHPVRST